MKEVNKKQEAIIAKIKSDIVVHIVTDNGDVYMTLAHKIRVRIDKSGYIVNAWVDLE